MLDILTLYQPRAIGLDIYRDILVPRGARAGCDFDQKSAHHCGEETRGEGTVDGVAAPAVLEHTDQVGFSDIVVDRGGIVRRGLLFLDDGETAAYSFALRLALLRLKAEGIEAAS